MHVTVFSEHPAISMRVRQTVNKMADQPRYDTLTLVGSKLHFMIIFTQTVHVDECALIFYMYTHHLLFIFWPLHSFYLVFILPCSVGKRLIIIILQVNLYLWSVSSANN